MTRVGRSDRSASQLAASWAPRHVPTRGFWCLAIASAPGCPKVGSRAGQSGVKRFTENSIAIGTQWTRLSSAHQRALPRRVRPPKFERLALAIGIDKVLFEKVPFLVGKKDGDAICNLRHITGSRRRSNRAWPLGRFAERRQCSFDTDRRLDALAKATVSNIASVTPPSRIGDLTLMDNVARDDADVGRLFRAGCV